VLETMTSKEIGLKVAIFQPSVLKKREILISNDDK